MIEGFNPHIAAILHQTKLYRDMIQKEKETQSKQLINYQKEFILNHFFKDERYSGWYNIGKLLLENGECVVAGDKCIWHGGIGNFIKVREADKQYVNCSLYKFDLEEFLNSEWYKEVSSIHLSNLLDDINELKDKLHSKYKEHEEISALLTQKK